MSQESSKSKRVIELTDILCAAEGAKGIQDRVIIRRAVQRLHDMGELTRTVLA